MPVDQRRLAERRLLAALRRFHREQPLVSDIRTDALLARVRASDRVARPATHRGATRLTLDDAALRAIVNELVSRGSIRRSGRRLRLDQGQAPVDPALRQRVDRLLEELRQAGASPPRVEPIALRHGVPEHALRALRRSGQLVRVAPGIDYPADVYAHLIDRIRGMASSGPLSVAAVRDALACSRRQAAALLSALDQA